MLELQAWLQDSENLMTFVFDEKSFVVIPDDLTQREDFIQMAIKYHLIEIPAGEWPSEPDDEREVQEFVDMQCTRIVHVLQKQGFIRITLLSFEAYMKQ